MKLPTLISLAALTIATAMAAYFVSRVGPTDAPPQSKSQTLAKHLTVAGNSHDLGVLVAPGVNRRIIQIENSLDDEVTVFSLEASCDCLTTTKLPIQIRENTTLRLPIEVVLASDAAHTPSTIYKAWIRLNTSVGTAEFDLAGKLAYPLDVSSLPVRLGGVKASTLGPVALDTSLKFSLGFSPYRVEVEGEGLLAGIERDSSESSRVRLLANGGQRIGKHRAVLNIHCDRDGVPLSDAVKIPVAWEVEGAIRTDAHAVDFGVIERENVASATLELHSAEPLPFRIEQAICAIGGVRVSSMPFPAEYQGTATIEFECRPTHTGIFDSVITIIGNSDFHGRFSLQVPVHFVVPEKAVVK